MAEVQTLTSSLEVDMLRAAAEVLDETVPLQVLGVES